MRELLLLKARDNHRLFKKNQKLWAIWSTGALAARVVGRYKGIGRWVTAWVHWEDPDNLGKSMSGKPDADWKGYSEVSDEFYKFIEKKQGVI